MKISKFCAVMGLLAGALAMAGAQGFRMMGGGGGSPGMVLYGFGPEGPTLRSDVAKELKLTDAQKAKLDEFQQKQMEEMMASFQGGGGPPSQDAIQAMMKKRAEAEEKALKEILDEGQRKRLRELWLQQQGNAAILNEAIQKELGLGDDQKKKVKDLQAKQQEANAAVREKIMNGEIDRSEIRPLMEKNSKIMSEELGKILTAEQAAKLKALQGAPFKFENPGGGN